MAYSLIDTEESLRVALSKTLSCLTGDPLLYLDVEGHKLGRFGTLDLLQLHVLPLQETFVFDVFTLQEKVFVTSVGGFSLKSILESDIVTKVFFDVRNDSDALFTHFGVKLRGVVDLQLMEYYQPGRSERNLLGLQACIERHSGLEPGVIYSWIRTKKDMVTEFDTANRDSIPLFQQRPMPERLLRYCAEDVAYMPRLYQLYRLGLGRGPWQTVQAESHNRVAQSQGPRYDPHAKGKGKGPFRLMYKGASQTPYQSASQPPLQHKPPPTPSTKKTPVNPEKKKPDKVSKPKYDGASTRSEPLMASLTQKMQGIGIGGSSVTGQQHILGVETVSARTCASPFD